METVVGLAVSRLAQGPGTGALAGGAIDADGVAADEVGAGAEQKDDGGGHLGLAADALQRHVILEVADHVLHRLGVGVHAAGGDPARRYGVDPHAGVAPLVGGGLGEVLHTSACGAGMAHAGHAAPHVGEHVDDAAAVLAQALQEDFLGHQKTAHQVGAHHGLEAFLVDADQRRGELAAGVVDQVMDASALREHRGDHGLYRLFITDVADLEAGAAAVLGDLGAGLLQLFLLAPDQHHMGAQVGQLVGHAATDAAAAAGDQNGLVSEQARFEYRVVCHCCFPCCTCIGLCRSQLAGDAFALLIAGKPAPTGCRPAPWAPAPGIPAVAGRKPCPAGRCAGWRRHHRPARSPAGS